MGLSPSALGGLMRMFGPSPEPTAGGWAEAGGALTAIGEKLTVLLQRVREARPSVPGLPASFALALDGTLADLEAAPLVRRLAGVYGLDGRSDAEAKASARLVGRWLLDLLGVMTGPGAGDPGSYPLPSAGLVHAFAVEAGDEAARPSVAAARLDVLGFLYRTGFAEASGSRELWLAPGLVERFTAASDGTLGEDERMRPTSRHAAAATRALDGLETALFTRGVETLPRTLAALVDRQKGQLEAAVPGLPSTLLEPWSGGPAPAPPPPPPPSAPPGPAAAASPPAPSPAPRAPSDPEPAGAPSPWPTLLGFLGLGGLAYAWGARREDDRAPPPTDFVPPPPPRLPTREPAGPASASAGSGAPAAGRTSPPADPKASTLPSWLRGVFEGPLAARYTEMRVVGSGGMGTVVGAWDSRLRRKVAIKVAPPHLAGEEEFRARFLREAQALARLDHEGIARIHDVPEPTESEVPMLIMEFLEGEDLASRLKRLGPASGPEARAWLGAAAAAVQYAHSQGILHRDVKPANLFLLDSGKIKLVDFGLASIEEAPGLTQTGARMGSRAYMPPEQLRGEHVGPAADQYALAVTAFELVSGRLPFAPEDPFRARPASLAALAPWLGPAADPALARALDRHAEVRFPSVAEFWAAFAPALDGPAP